MPSVSFLTLFDGKTQDTHQVLDGGERELGDDGVVQERVPAVRQLHQREVARELDPAVHRHQVVRLKEMQHST